MSQDLTPEDLAYLSLVGWAGYCDPSWVAYPHLVYLCQKLEEVARAVAEGKRKNLMVFMPSQHGKSTAVSRFFTSWALGRYPETRIILASYASNLAELWGRRARDTLAEHGAPVFGVKVRADSKAADHWELVRPYRGVFHAVGVASGTSGHPAEIVVIDDPVKDRDEAESETIRKKIIEWWTSVIVQRRPKGKVILMTRWHTEDLAGWLLEHEPNEWEVVRFPAIAHEHDVLGRAPGDALCPDIVSLGVYAKERALVGPYVWASMYDQIPTPRGGGMFKRDRARYYSIMGNELIYRDDGRFSTSNDLERFITVDTATSTKESADHTAIAAWGYDQRTARLNLLDLDLRRIEGPKIMEAIVSMCDRWKTIAYIEENSTSKHLLSFMESEGIPFRTLSPGAMKKFTRALPASAMWERGGVTIPESAEWLAAFERQIYNFTGEDGGDDDCVDVLAYAARVVLEEIDAGSVLVPATTTPLKDKFPTGFGGKAPRLK